jgi:hypothetical protein
MPGRGDPATLAGGPTTHIRKGQSIPDQNDSGQLARPEAPRPPRYRAVARHPLSTCHGPAPRTDDRTPARITWPGFLLVRRGNGLAECSQERFPSASGERTPASRRRGRWCRAPRPRSRCRLLLRRIRHSRLTEAEFARRQRREPHACGRQATGVRAAPSVSGTAGRPGIPGGCGHFVPVQE